MIKDIIKYGEAEVTYKNKQLLAEKPKLYNLFWETTLRCNAKKVKAIVISVLVALAILGVMLMNYISTNF